MSFTINMDCRNLPAGARLPVLQKCKFYKKIVISMYAYGIIKYV